jgi:hypothetical protein
MRPNVVVEVRFDPAIIPMLTDTMPAFPERGKHSVQLVKGIGETQHWDLLFDCWFIFGAFDRQ